MSLILSKISVLALIARSLINQIECSHENHGRAFSQNISFLSVLESLNVRAFARKNISKTNIFSKINHSYASLFDQLFLILRPPLKPFPWPNQLLILRLGTILWVSTVRLRSSFYWPDALHKTFFSI